MRGKKYLKKTRKNTLKMRPKIFVAVHTLLISTLVPEGRKQKKKKKPKPSNQQF